MISPQRNRSLPLLNQRAHPGFNRLERILIRKRQVPRIPINAGDPRSTPASVHWFDASQRNASRIFSEGLRRSAQVRRLGIKRNSQEGW